MVRTRVVFEQPRNISFRFSRSVRERSAGPRLRPEGGGQNKRIAFGRRKRDNVFAGEGRSLKETSRWTRLDVFSHERSHPNQSLERDVRYMEEKRKRKPRPKRPLEGGPPDAFLSRPRNMRRRAFMCDLHAEARFQLTTPSGGRAIHLNVIDLTLWRTPC